MKRIRISKFIYFSRLIYINIKQYHFKATDCFLLVEILNSETYSKFLEFFNEDCCELLNFISFDELISYDDMRLLFSLLFVILVGVFDTFAGLFKFFIFLSSYLFISFALFRFFYLFVAS